jgi:hypothetical protein
LARRKGKTPVSLALIQNKDAPALGGQFNRHLQEATEAAQKALQIRYTLWDSI